MKKIVLLMLTTLMLSISANAGMLTSLSGWTADKIKPDAYYTVDTAGENVRIYEFTPKTAPHMTCVMMFTESQRKSPTKQCFLKQEYVK